MEIELTTVIAAILQVCVGGRRSFAPSSVRKMIQHLNGAAARVDAALISAKMQPHFSTLTRCGCIEFVPTVQLRNRPRRITNRDRLQDLIDNPARIHEFLPDDIEVVPEAADLIEHVLVPEGTEQPYREDAILDVRRELLEALEEHENGLLEMMSDSNQKLFDKLHGIEQQISSLRELLDQTHPRFNKANLCDNTDTGRVSIAPEPEPETSTPVLACDANAGRTAAEMICGEDLPEWLRLWKNTHQISMTDFFASRVVFYPGSGTDGQPVKFFGSRHAAHCFVFVDYGITRPAVERELSEHPFEGYRTVGRRELSMHDLTPNGWIASIKTEVAPEALQATVPPYAFLEVLERQPGFDDTHGPQRLAILILCADGVAAYDALFCQANSPAPFAVVLQDHGWGGNWTMFGHGGALERLASGVGRLPEFLLVAQNTDAWAGYTAIDGTTLGGGGMHGFERQLWQRSGLAGDRTIAPQPLFAEVSKAGMAAVVDPQLPRSSAHVEHKSSEHATPTVPAPALRQPWALGDVAFDEEFSVNFSNDQDLLDLYGAVLRQISTVCHSPQGIQVQLHVHYAQSGRNRDLRVAWQFKKPRKNLLRITESRHGFNVWAHAPAQQLVDRGVDASPSNDPLRSKFRVDSNDGGQADWVGIALGVALQNGNNDRGQP